MSRRAKYVGACFLGLVIAFGSANRTAADDAKPTPTKAPDFSKYVYMNDITGEVVKADESKVTIKVTYLVPGKTNNPRVPARPQQQSKEVEYQFVPDLSLVRFENKSLLPPKMDDKGKKVAYTQKELDGLKTPTGVVGYAAAPSDLTKGSTVNLILVREKSIPASKATDDDLRIKYAVIKAQPQLPTIPNK